VSVALTPDVVAREYRALVQNKGYRAFPIGGEAGHYLRWKRGVLTDTSYRDYEACLDKLARFFSDLELADLEPPIGTERLEEFLEHQWGEREPRTYNKNLSILRDFFKWAALKGKLHGDPTLAIRRRKSRDVHRETFSRDIIVGIIAAQENRRDRLAVRLLLLYGLRKGALRGVRFQHFDHQRRQLTIFTKGKKIRAVRLPDPDFWMDLERHILDIEAKPSDYLLNARKWVFWKYGAKGEKLGRWFEYHDRPMGEHGAHDWWYGCLAAAGLVPRGTTSGQRMHKARHTAGQLLLDTGENIKAVQKLLGHAHVSTTLESYVDWDIDQLEESLKRMLQSFPTEE
jgi:integrase